jgi:thymidine phosphorylase
MVINEFYPSLWEVTQAENVFKNSLNKEYTAAESGVISKEMALKLAVIAVWRAGREYQADKQSKALKPCGQL